MMKNSRNVTASIAGLAAVTMLLGAAPAAATSVGPRDGQRFGDSVDRKQVREHERIRKQQVRQTQGTPLYRPFFAPLYEGSNSPWQRMKRSFD